MKLNAPATIHSKLRIIKRLQKRVNLWDSDAVEKYIINARAACLTFSISRERAPARLTREHSDDSSNNKLIFPFNIAL